MLIVRNGYPFFLLNDEQLSNRVRVQQQPAMVYHLERIDGANATPTSLGLSWHLTFCHHMAGVVHLNDFIYPGNPLGNHVSCFWVPSPVTKRAMTKKESSRLFRFAIGEVY